MIHYRLINPDNSPASDTVYRSLARARKACGENVRIYAYPSRAQAVRRSSPSLRVRSVAPVMITSGAVATFLDHHAKAKAIHPQYPPRDASSRRRLEEVYDWDLFGFDELGRAIDALMLMSVSCLWVRYSCPIEINGRRSNITGLKKAL